MAQSLATSSTALLGARSSFPLAVRCRTQRQSRLATPVRAGNPFVGETNDPQKVKQRKDEKAKEAFWAEPNNKNPLEKTTLSREGFGAQSKELKDEGAVNEAIADLQEKGADVGEGIKEGISGAAEKVSDAVKKVTGQN